MQVAEDVKAAMKEISRDFPEGLSYDIPFDITTYISESIHEVYKTLFEALCIGYFSGVPVFAELAGLACSFGCRSYLFSGNFRGDADLGFLFKYAYSLGIGIGHRDCCG